MELRKTSENVSRTFDAEGNATDRVDHIGYDVRDDDGNVIGSAYVNGMEAMLSISVRGFGTVTEGEAKLKETFGISG